MKFKTLLFLFCFGLLGSSFAAENHHLTAKTSKTAVQGMCRVDIINQSYDDVIIYAVRTENNIQVIPFVVPYGYRDYIDVSCGYGVQVDARRYADNYPLWYGYLQSGERLLFSPLLAGKAQVSVQR